MSFFYTLRNILNQSVSAYTINMQAFFYKNNKLYVRDPKQLQDSKY